MSTFLTGGRPTPPREIRGRVLPRILAAYRAEWAVRHGSGPSSPAGH